MVMGTHKGVNTCEGGRLRGPRSVSLNMAKNRVSVSASIEKTAAEQTLRRVYPGQCFKKGGTEDNNTRGR